MMKALTKIKLEKSRISFSIFSFHIWFFCALIQLINSSLTSCFFTLCLLLLNQMTEIHPTGLTSNSMCANCPTGKLSSPKRTYCLDCKAGEYNSNNVTCVKCQPGESISLRWPATPIFRLSSQPIAIIKCSNVHRQICTGCFGCRLLYVHIW